MASAVTGVIDRFATGSYQVTRRPAGSYSAGVGVAAAPETFTVTAVVEPLSTQELRALGETQAGTDTRVVYSKIELKTRTATHAPDLIEVDGGTWEVVRVEPWKAWGSVHFRSYIALVVQ